MKSLTHEFTSRQIMNHPFYEFFHYLDASAPEVEFHSHDFYEVLIYLKGDISYCVEGRMYQLRPGDILFTHPSDIHRPFIKSQKPYERYVLWLSETFISHSKEVGDDLSACFSSAKEKKYCLIRPQENTLLTIHQHCQKIQRLMGDHSFGSSNLLYGAINDLLVFLNRAYFETPDSIRDDIDESDIVNQVIGYMDTHLSEELSLEELAEKFHISKYYLSRRFKLYTGLPLYQFLMKKRLGVSLNLLEQGMPVLEASLACGFGDYSNYLKAFKREYGQTPKYYQRDKGEAFVRQ